MRVINDREEKTQPDLGFLGVFSHSLLIAVGFATVVLGPLPVILAHFRLADPWPKVATVLGALIALTFLDISMPVVAICFIFSLVVADGIHKERRLWRLAFESSALVGTAGIAGLAIAGWQQKLDLAHTWSGLIDAWMAQMESVMHVEKAIQWDLIRGVFLYEGPFLYLSGALLSLWFSIGIAAHMGWIPEGHRYSAPELRKERLPASASALFVVLFLVAVFAPVRAQHVFGGIFRLASAVMFIQGCICLSEVLSRRSCSMRVRTLVYSVAVILGFYALMGMGVLSPFLLRRKQELEEVV